MGCCLMWPTSGLSILAAASCGQLPVCQYGLLPLWPTSGLSIWTAASCGQLPVYQNWLLPHVANFRFVNMGCWLMWPTSDLSIWTAASMAHFRVVNKDCSASYGPLPVCPYGLLPHVANSKFVNMDCCLMWPTPGLSIWTVASCGQLPVCQYALLPHVANLRFVTIVYSLPSSSDWQECRNRACHFYSRPGSLMPTYSKLSSLPNQISGRSSLKEKIKPTRWDMKYSCHVTKVRDSWQDILQKQWKMGLPKPSCHHVIEY